MAKTKKTAENMSRRQMVTLLGSGVVFAGTIKAEDIVAEAQSNCGPAALQEGKGTDGRLMLVADLCCVDGAEIVHAGRGGKAASTRAAGDLKNLDEVLGRAKKESLLLEYCVMMWGLTAKQRDEAVTELKSRYLQKK
jgi:hypothetical protein